MAVALVTRTQWDARPPAHALTFLPNTKGTKVHYVGGRVDPKIVDDHAICISMVRGIQAFHIDGRDWSDIAYNLLACPHRRVFVGRGAHRMSAANGPGMNTAHYAICALLGDSGFVSPTDGLLHAIRDGIDYLRDKGEAGNEIKGHRDGYATECPGAPLYAWVKAGAPRPGQAAHPPMFPGRLLYYVSDEPMIHGPDVTLWQTAAKKIGGTISAVDGWYGPNSRSVCTTLQRMFHLEVDGIVGRLTWDATMAEAAS